MSEEKKQAIKDDYNRGHSPLQIAIKHDVEVGDVYQALEMYDMLHVVFSGDQIDDAGPNAEINSGKVFRVPYTKN